LSDTSKTSFSIKGSLAIAADLNNKSQGMNLVRNEIIAFTGCKYLSNTHRFFKSFICWVQGMSFGYIEKLLKDFIQIAGLHQK